MKTNAIIRIVIYSVVILLLVGLLCSCFGLGTLVFDFGTSAGEYVTGEASVAAADISRLKINWACGSIKIATADTDTITFSESGFANDKQRMTFTQSGSTLTLDHRKSTFQIGFVSTPQKDLTITVPEDWSCQELSLDGADLDVQINGLSVKDLDIDGASCNIRFTGSVDSVDCDGASMDLTLSCTDRPREINLDGASCELDLTLPKECGFRVEMEGLNCDFHSNLAYTTVGDSRVYADGYCSIDADGVSCKITIQEAS